MSTQKVVHLITGREAFAEIDGNAEACVALVADAYDVHHKGQSVLPNSGFLQLPSERGRVISLPAYIGGPFGLAGIKWIASVPANTASGLARASAMLILNDVATGYAFACLEASAISAARTAASGVLAAELLAGGRRAARIGIVGTGRISAEVARFLIELDWDVGEWRLFDLDASAAARFGERLRARTDAPVRDVTDVAAAFDGCDVVVVATVAGTPHLCDPRLLVHNPAVIHLSLRDFDPELLAGARNYTDDADHVFRENTSLLLAENRFGHRRFLEGDIRDLMDGRYARDPDRPAIFSPFGLGVLDVALGKWVYDRVVSRGGGTEVADFFGLDGEVL
jgi:2,3-diaminopropionate biosynthesis protein SbnB